MLAQLHFDCMSRWWSWYYVSHYRWFDLRWL